MAKKKKRSPEQMHRQIQDSLQALPYAVAEHKKNGKRAKALLLEYVSGPMLRLMNKALSAKRYRGTEGAKLKQTDQMRRRLEQKQTAMKHLQANMPKQRKGRPQ